MLREMLRDYDIRLKPNYLGKPVEVTVDATILSFTNLDAINMVSMDLYTSILEIRIASKYKKMLILTEARNSMLQVST